VTAPKVVDVDAHVLEPSDLWEKNLEPRFRARALRIRRDEQGFEYLEIDGKKSAVMSGGFFGGFGLLDEGVEERVGASLEAPGGPEYEASVPQAARELHARLSWMDENRVDISLLYPSLCLGWQSECDDIELASAYCRVYNDWLTDLCRPSQGRLVPIALVPLLRVEAAVAELERASELGARGLYLFPVPPNGLSYGDPSYDPLWRACQERQMPVGIHVGNSPLHVGHELYQTNFTTHSWWQQLMHTPSCQLAFASLFQGGVLERFPSLSVGVVETGCGWIAHWLELMDTKFRMTRHALMKSLPSEYFERQCWISGEPHERTFSAMAELVGAHKLMWGSDYPHEEGNRRPLELLDKRIDRLPVEDRAKILGGNAVAAYGLV
jgi:predicted TIM-barrel fold metal-dependent hydrolase